MSPDVALVRDGAENVWVRLRDVLLVKALQGVKVYVLLYREVKSVLPDLKSVDVKTALTKLHPNIRVIRHPNHVRCVCVSVCCGVCGTCVHVVECV